ncbi:hypothetical protein SAMN04488020_101257 [Palleronia marisminoris]|uniref:Uncharacterized protein n=1 Tax=Palleronia marisminoris TaxID=315423 RepID=A0A1Y5RGL5_9RHOB|nr:hypothetical protein [Palleronia marisminoris]SFG13079.1 hypothetical protein SAMN04488020_101257 [Palleronia marisminoris]SLN14404.1 hypothetical protein PAM7066_00258 [Palleronia marisminoris]
MRLTQDEIRDILGALDRDEVARVADLNGTTPELTAALQKRFGCKVDLVAIGAEGEREAVSDGDLAAYRAAVAGCGGVPEAIRGTSPDKKVHPYDVIVTLGGFGSSLKIKHLRGFLQAALHGQSRLVLDIKLGSGSYPFLNGFGTCHTLIEPAQHRPGRAIMSATSPSSNSGQWSAIARDLAGARGFFHDLGEHSMLFQDRSETLVVTFDNLDIAMEKRDERRPWGYSFIEAQGWSMLGVMADGWTWFRDVAVDEAFLRLSRDRFFDRFSRVIFYGASMGGYGAAAFSAAAPGSTVFVTSPQSTLDKAVVPWEMRYKTAWGRNFSGPFGDAAAASRTAKAVHLLYDPYVAADAAHAARFTGRNVLHWPCPLLGHRLGSSLHQMGALKEITVAAIEERLDRQSFYRLLRKRRDLPRYQRELVHQAVERGHPELALKVCNHVLARREDKALSGIARQLKNLA